MGIKRKNFGPDPNNFPKAVPARAETADEDKQTIHRLRKELRKAKRLLREMYAGLSLPLSTRIEINEILSGPEH